MEFDWDRAIERNFEDIEAIFMRLCALVGVTSLAPFVATLPRHLHIRVRSILRPAEYAVRRLIAMAAARLDVAPPPEPRADAAKAAPKRPETKPAAADPDRIPPFPLFDPFKPLWSPFLSEEEIAALGDSEPELDPAPFRAALPWDEPVDARNICRRLQSLRLALMDFDRQALRLARWRVRKTRPQRWSPFRIGRPPGWRHTPKTEIEEVLKECHFLARDIWFAPDTS